MRQSAACVYAGNAAASKQLMRARADKYGTAYSKMFASGTERQGMSRIWKRI